MSAKSRRTRATVRQVRAWWLASLAYGFNAIVTLRALTSVRRALEPRAQRKSRLREDRRPPRSAPLIYIPLDISPTPPAHSPAHCDSTRCPAATPPTSFILLLLTSLLHHRVNFKPTYHVHISHSRGTTFHVLAHLRYGLSLYLPSIGNTELQPEHLQNTAHRRLSRCRGETAA